MISVKENLLNALEKNEFIAFLKGDFPYAVQFHQFTPANLPTDFEQVLSNGIYILYEEYPDINIKGKLEEALIEMRGQKDIDIYLAVNIFFEHILNETYGASPFEICKERLIPVIKEKLKIHKETLKKCFEWEGMGKEQGMWEDIQRINNIIMKKKGFSIV